MKKQILINFSIYALVTAALAVTTFLSPAVYGSWWFVALWSMFALTLLVTVCTTRMWHNPGRFLLHISFLAMLGGGLLTWTTRTEGRVRIAPEETATQFIDENGTRHALPTPVKLERFETVYYPGGMVPRDYISHLEVEGEKRIVSMNNILELDGWRLLQYSFDEEGGTVLSVSHDPYGMYLSYTGYLIFAIGGLLLLLAPRGRYRKILKATYAGCLILMAGGNLSAATIDGVPPAMTDSLRSRQVLYNGKLVTFNTLARDVMMKIYGKESYRGLSAEQTLLSLKLFPEAWKEEPLIKIKEKAIGKALGIDGNHASLSQLFDAEGNYLVERLYYTMGRERTRAIEDLDEKVGIILSLFSGDLITPRPEEMAELSRTHVQAELLYNDIPFTKIIFMILFTGFFTGMGGLLLKSSAGGKAEFLRRLTYILLCIAMTLSTVSFAMQWYLSDRIPLANTFETLQFVVIVTGIVLLIMGRKNLLLLSPGMLMAGALALVAHLVASNPVVTPLMPVLHSGWLSLHVTLVMISYALLGFTFVISAVGLCNASHASNMRALSNCMLYPGVYFLGLGIFTGAVWANVSWGQYWQWDPKETWALITLLVYALPLHTSLKFFKSDRIFHLYLIFAILSIAMTYFGVNHLDSLHAYN